MPFPDIASLIRATHFQVMGFADRDADVVAVARWLMASLPPVAVQR